MMLDFLTDDLTNIYDFLFWGTLSGAVGYAYYLIRSIDADPADNHVFVGSPKGFFLGFLGIMLSGMLGGLMAVAVDNSISVSIFVGLFSFFIWTSLVKSLRKGITAKNIRDLILRLMGVNLK